MKGLKERNIIVRCGGEIVKDIIIDRYDIILNKINYLWLDSFNKYIFH
jgi:hypothetical protein